MLTGASRRSGRQRGKPARQRNSSLLESARQLQAHVRRPASLIEYRSNPDVVNTSVNYGYNDALHRIPWLHVCPGNGVWGIVVFCKRLSVQFPRVVTGIPNLKASGGVRAGLEKLHGCNTAAGEEVDTHAGISPSDQLDSRLRRIVVDIDRVRRAKHPTHLRRVGILAQALNHKVGLSEGTPRSDRIAGFVDDGVIRCRWWLRLTPVARVRLRAG